MTERARTDATTDAQRTDAPLLSVEGLEKHYPITEGLLRREVGRVRAVDGVSFEIGRGEALGLVGESGCGKSTTALSILQLEEPTAGTVAFDGVPIEDRSGRELRSFRRRAQLIVQDPNEAFSPRMTVGEAVAEPLRLHGMDDAERRRAIVTDTLERVGLSADAVDRYPHAFSGGEKQRISIARALVVNPDLIVADEPTSALDGRVKTEIIGLLDRIRTEFDVSVLFISHDIDVVRRFCDRVAVMYLGEIVERGPTERILERPRHPYTRVLIGSVPSLDPDDRTLVRPLTETIPEPANPPSGCRFHTRCPELIPPDGVELPDEQWRAVAGFRFTLAEGVDLDVDGSEPAAALRARYDLPDPVDDEAVEAAVDDAIDALLDGEAAAARERLAEALESPCERTAPPAVATEGGTVACHRYDEGHEAEPLPWPRA